MGTTECRPEKGEIDDVLEVLSHHLRREVVHYFENVSDDETADFDELTAHVAACVPEHDREELLVVLLHVHLPKLREDGWLEFDERSEEIRYHGHEAASRLLRCITEIFTE